MSPQGPSHVYHEFPGVNSVHLPNITTKDQFLSWADTRGAVASVAELNDPQDIFLHLDPGQLPRQLLRAQGLTSSGPSHGCGTLSLLGTWLAPHPIEQVNTLLGQ